MHLELGSLATQPFFRQELQDWSPRAETIAGRRASWIDVGAGAPLVFIHGTPSWSYEYRHLIRALGGSFRCLAPDLLGFGLSERPPEGVSLGEQIDFARAWLRHVGVRDYTLVVHDYGGPIGLSAADPAEVRRVVVMNSWCWPLEQGQPSLKRQKPLLRSALMRWLYLHANFSPRVMVTQSWGSFRPLTAAEKRGYRALFPTPDSRATTWEIARAIASEPSGFAGLEALGARYGSTPVHLIWGAADKFVGAGQRALWKEYFSVKSETLLEKVGHFPQEEAPELVLRALRAIVEAQEEGRP